MVPHDPAPTTATRIGTDEDANPRDHGPSNGQNPDMALTAGPSISTRLQLPAALLLAAQIVHVVVSSTSTSFEDEAEGGEGAIGLPVGLLFLIANIVVLVGLRRERAWAPSATAIVGFAVAVGFVLYHGAPFSSWATNPYWDAAGAVDWLGVGVCLVTGAWCAIAGWPRVGARTVAS